MIGALIILAALLAVGALLWFTDRKLPQKRLSEASESAEVSEASEGSEPSQSAEETPCCGMHITCQKDSLVAMPAEKPEYFDDEELDAFAARAPQTYTDEETEQFREILITLLPDDIAPWARSLQQRNIALPAPVKEELLMIVAEARRKSEK